MKNKNIGVTPKKDKFWFKCYKGFMKIFKKKVTFKYLGEEFKGGSIIICNHESTKSPLAFELFSNKSIRFWGAEEMNSGFKRMYKYQTEIYYHKKKHWNLFLARVFCLLATPLTWLFYKGLNLISIKKGVSLSVTLKDTLTILNEYKESIVIFPEDSSNGYLEVLQGFHNGFLLLAEYCYKKGVDTPIVVCYFNKKTNVMVVDQPINYSELIKNGETRQEISNKLLNRCNELGQLKY